jgi:hypothetical protein
LQLQLPEAHVQSDSAIVKMPAPHAVQTSGAPGHRVPSGQPLHDCALSPMHPGVRPLPGEDDVLQEKAIAAIKTTAKNNMNRDVAIMGLV